ncbi:MAG: substrate-binding domain-containing protein, partial [Chloroflexota bacterium]|nr:substrate-binding domain-containing protein [Chloroflexota bacterium]
QLATGVELAAREAELAVLICNTFGDPRQLAEYLRVLRARRVDAMVLSGGSSLGQDQLRMAVDSGLPLVVIGRPGVPMDLAYISVDNVAAARAATDHLVDQRRRGIAHLAGPSGQTTMIDRCAGYRQSLAAHGLDARVLATDGLAEHAYRVVRRALRQGGPRPDAIFAATDRLAIAAMAAVVDAGLRVPYDVAVVGFDDSAVAAHLRPSLSSVSQPAVELGRGAVRMVLALAGGRSVRTRVLRARLVARASSAARAQEAAG